MNEKVSVARSITGKVISSSMDKTITIRIDRLVKHPLYGKYVRRSSKILSHDESNEANVGDTVVVTACKPISKRKVWNLDKILDRSK